MKLTKLKKEFGQGYDVSRNSRRKETTVKVRGLQYILDERRFEDEREMAEHLKSKAPAAVIIPPGH